MARQRQRRKSRRESRRQSHVSEAKDFHIKNHHHHNHHKHSASNGDQKKVAGLVKNKDSHHHIHHRKHSFRQVEVDDASDKNISTSTLQDIEKKIEDVNVEVKKEEIKKKVKESALEVTNVVNDMKELDGDINTPIIEAKEVLEEKEQSVAPSRQSTYSRRSITLESVTEDNEDEEEEEEDEDEDVIQTIETPG